MQNIDTGFLENDYPLAVPEGEPEEPKQKKVYPEFTIRDKAAKKIKMAADEDGFITATVKLKVVEFTETEGSSHRWRQDGCSCSLELRSIELEGKQDEEEEESAEEAIDSYRASKS